MTQPIKKRKGSKCYDFSRATDRTPMRIAVLAKYLQIGRTQVYRAMQQGYRVEYPWLRMTSAAHFLDWCKRTGSLPDSEDDARRRKEKLERLTGRTGSR